MIIRSYIIEITRQLIVVSGLLLIPCILFGELTWAPYLSMGIGISFLVYHFAFRDPHYIGSIEETLKRRSDDHGKAFRSFASATNVPDDFACEFLNWLTEGFDLSPGRLRAKDRIDFDLKGQERIDYLSDLRRWIKESLEFSQEEDPYRFLRKIRKKETTLGDQCNIPTIHTAAAVGGHSPQLDR